MKKFVNSKEVYAAKLPDWQHLAIVEAVRGMEGIFGLGYDPARGFVILVEENDKLPDADLFLCCPLECKLEGTWRRHGCLVALVLWGNSGDGVTFVCPEKDGYAEDIQSLLKSHL